MKFKSYIPKKLSVLVDAIWEHQADTPLNWKVLPSGKIELIFILGSSIQLLSAKNVCSIKSEIRNDSFLGGLHTRPLHFESISFHCIGISMKPQALKAIFGIPACEMADLALDGNALLKDSPEVVDALNCGTNFINKAVYLESFMQKLITENSDLYMSLALQRMVEELKYLPPFFKMDILRKKLGYSKAHTHRIFHEWFGLPPARYMRLKYFIDTVNVIHSKPTDSFTDIGYKMGFYDNAHFNRFFKEFAGTTPGAYQKLMTPEPFQIPGTIP